MLRRLTLGVLTVALLVPNVATAAIDPRCAVPSATSAINGRVENAQGVPVQGVLVELYTTNDSRPTADNAITDANGNYLICAGSASGAGHNTYDVHVRDVRATRQYATVNQPYSTWSNLGPADFTPASGLPLLYLTSLTIDPAEISTASTGRTVTFTVRSKAPTNTMMRLLLDHLGSEVAMTYDRTESGWNIWEYESTFVKNSVERVYWATVWGTSGVIRITENDRQPYVIDNTKPLFGLATSSAGQCGPGVHANPISPASPPGTTNPQPIVVHGVCDHYSDGARSGLDPFSLTGRICTNYALTAGCSPINPVLSTLNIVWWPSAPLALGDYYIEWTISDKAGNTSISTPQLLRVTDSGGQTPVITALSPGNLGSGFGGVVVGSSLTSPSSYPFVGFRVTDADGQTDLVPGSLAVRIYSPDERTLVYTYDPTKGPNEYDALTRRGGATFDLSSGMFRATGFPLQGKPPGRYLASASISDHGGNGATMSWHWILVAAA